MSSWPTTFKELARGWARRPVSLAFVIVALALGVGANSTVYSIVHAALFRTIPARQPSQVVRVFTTDTRGGSDLGWISRPVYKDYHELSAVFSGLALYRDGLTVHLSEGTGGPAPVPAALVSPSLFQVLGADPAQGRLLQRADASGNASPPIVVVSHRFWQRRYAGDPGAVGETLDLLGQRFEIVGVAPEALRGLNLGRPVDLWFPLGWIDLLEPTLAGQQRHRASTFFRALGRLPSGRTVEGAQAQLTSLATNLGAGEPSGTPEDREAGFVEPWPHLVPLQADLHPDHRRLAWALMLATGAVLLIACVDVANVLGSRVYENRQSTAVKLALGARRGHLVRGVLLEALLLAVCGALAGLLVATWLHQLILSLDSSAAVPSLTEGLSLTDPRVLLFTGLVAGVASVVVATIPAVRITETRQWRALRGQRSAIRLARWRFPLQHLLVVLQVAASVVLIAIAALLIRTLVHLTRVDPGFEMEQVLVADLEPGRYGYDAEVGQSVLERLEGEATQLAGVSEAALSTVGALPPPRGGAPLVPGSDERKKVGQGLVSRGYFETLGVPVVRGVDFETARRRGLRGSAIVNQTLAREFWPGEDVVGKALRGIGPEELTVQIVGVVEDLRNAGLRRPPTPVLFLPFEEWYQAFPWQPSSTTLLLRTEGRPRSMAPTLLSVGHELAPDLPLIDVESLERRFGAQIAYERFLGLLLVFQGSLGLVLVGVGLYGLMGSLLTERRHELAIRLTLGASRWEIVRQVYTRSLVLVAVGAGVGLTLVIPFSRPFSGLFLQASPMDPATWLPTLGVIGLVALLAPLSPLRQILRQDVAATLGAP